MKTSQLCINIKALEGIELIILKTAKTLFTHITK